MMIARKGADLAKRRILIVEDEFLIALDLEDALGELGWEVVGPAATVADALRLVCLLYTSDAADEL